MLKNFLKISWRTLHGQPLYSLISILGLTIGITSCLVACLFVWDDFSYDRYHTQGKNIYRLAVERIYPEHSSFYASVPSSYAQVIGEEIPEVKATLRLYKPLEEMGVRIESKKWKETKILFADSTFFDLFSIPLIEGNSKSVLREVNSLVLTQSTAHKYFGNQSPIGKTIETDLGSFIVSGICADVPRHSHFDFDLIGNFQHIKFPIQEPNYLFFNAYTYLLLTPGASQQGVEKKISALVEKYAAGQVKRHLGIDYHSYKRAGNGYRYFLQPLHQIHLHSQLEGELKTNGNYLYLLLFGLVAVLLLTIAILNYINLSTARSIRRIKEVRVRKVLGANKNTLTKQFLTESTLVSFLGILSSFLLLWLLLPFLNQLSGRELPSLANHWLLILFSGVVTAILIGLLAGFYPAVVMASFPMISSQRSRLGIFSNRNSGRNLLVGFQFFVSTSLLMATLVIGKQVRFLQEKEVGFSKEDVLVLKGIEGLMDSLSDRTTALKQELLQVQGVEGVSLTNPVPGDASFGFQFRSDENHEVITTRGMIMDEDAAQTLELEFVSGRSFSKKYNDTYSLLLNEKAVKALGLKDPIGKRLQMISSSSDSLQNQWYTVIGIIKDFHYQSLQKEIEPLIIIHTANPLAYTPFMLVKIQAGSNNQQILNAIEKQWKKISPQEPLSSFFLEDYWHQLLEGERAYKKLFTIFTFITLALASGGLFGLSSYLMSRRQKEASIRKVLGASAIDITLLLSKDFFIMSLIAFLIAFPVSWYGLQEWLSTFAYRIELNVVLFIVAGLIVMVLGFSTIAFHLLKVVYHNPIKSLKEE